MRRKWLLLTVIGLVITLTVLAMALFMIRQIVRRIIVPLTMLHTGVEAIRQGDLNALALSIFLGMASSPGLKASFGFLMLDDPSQSLGTAHKEGLTEILDQVLDHRMVIVSSMDAEFDSLLWSTLTKAKTRYVFSDWTPERGPKVERE